MCLLDLTSVRVQNIREYQCASRMSICQLVVFVCNFILLRNVCLSVGNVSYGPTTTYATLPYDVQRLTLCAPSPDYQHSHTGMHLSNPNTSCLFPVNVRLCNGVDNLLAGFWFIALPIEKSKNNHKKICQNYMKQQHQYNMQSHQTETLKQQKEHNWGFCGLLAKVVVKQNPLHLLKSA